MSRRSFSAFLVARIAAGLGVILAVSAVNFLMIRLLFPEGFRGERGPVREVLDYHWGLITGLEMGRSTDFRNGFQPVTEMIGDGLPADLALFFGALVVGVVAGVAGGIVVGTRPGSIRARLLGVVAALAICAPVYWVGLMVILAFSPEVGGLPSLGLVKTSAYEPLTEDPLAWLQSLLVPWMVAGAPLAAICLRMTAQVVGESGSEDYVRTAVAKGLRDWTVARRHALPPALPPVVTFSGAYAPLLVGNALLVEQVFNIPGVFRNVTGAVSNGDFPLLQGVTILGAALVVGASLVVDIAVVRLDPRVLLRSGRV